MSRRLSCRAGHPAWCRPRRCTVATGLAGVHRSDLYRMPTGDGTAALVALWQPQPTDEMPQSATYVELLSGLDLVAPVLARLVDRRRERRLVRAQLRTSLDTLTASTRRAA